MKKFLLSVLAGFTALAMLAGCNQQPASGGQPDQSQASSETPSQDAPEPEAPEPAEDEPIPEAEPEEGKTLVVYFSASGNTRAVAQTIADTLDAELYELAPVEPYTDADLDWTTADSRVNREHEDSAHRTAIAGEKDLTGYDTIYLGYPLWWGDMPMILYTFLDTVDLSGKTVVPFCVHGGSGFSGTVRTIRELEPGADVLDGLTVSRDSLGDSEQEIAAWVNGLSVNQ